MGGGSSSQRDNYCGFFSDCDQQISEDGRVVRQHHQSRFPPDFLTYIFVLSVLVIAVVYLCRSKEE